MTQTIMFTDVEDSSKLRRSRGEASAQRALRSHGRVVRAQLEEHGGREVKTFGDGYLITFSSAKSAVSCAIAIQRAIAEHNLHSEEPLPRIRIGINIGEVIEEQGDVFGLPVDAAEHIQAKARAGQIFVSELVRGVVGEANRITFIERGRFKLKNFPERWRLYEVPWQAQQGGVKPVSRALLVADMVGAVSMIDRLGDEAWLDVIRDFYAIARAQCASHASDWTKTAGDTFLASFPSPDSAVRCAIDMQRAFAAHNQERRTKKLRVRVALHYGDVRREANELFGHAVAVVVLMSATGRPGDILASASLREQVKDETLDFGRGRRVEFRDLSGSFVIHRIRWR